jgi:hypothetical protein
MTSDELDKKIIEIKKRGLNNFVENELIADLRKEYYDKSTEQKIIRLTTTFRSNIAYLNRLHKEGCSAQKIKEFMGVEIPYDFNKIIYENQNLYSLRHAIIVSEFFGLPVELILFTDLEANGNTLKKEYPTLFRQSRS